jgi:hypothetical protein
VSFDADKYQDALRPWIFTAGRASWTAKPVSAPALARFYADFQSAGESERERLLAARSPRERAAIRRDAERVRMALLTRLLRLAFPAKLNYHWRGDPVRALLALPSGARDEALADFFLWAAARPKNLPIPTTPGTPSSAPSAST